MKIWITGTSKAPRTNYVADWLAEHLEAAGHEVYASGWDPVIRERGSWVEVLRSSGADLFIHADELRGGYACRKQPVAAAGVNVGGTALVAQACAEAVVPFVYLSTAEVTVGADLFALTKLAGEQAAQLYAGASGCQLIRLSGVYGPGAARGLDAPMPNRFIEQALAGDELISHTEIRRGWTYVSDAVRAIRLIVEDGRPGIWNVGRHDNELTMFELAQACAASAGESYAGDVGEAGWPPGAPATRALDTTALLSLGWEPQVELDEGLRETAAWLPPTRNGRSHRD